ncbi:MAG: DUF4417 domain-containing protein [Blautia sp.]|nr:DUF4417 domain-containing protein [Blautia sp.]
MHSITNLADLLDIINDLYMLLDGKIDFDAEGWPVFQKDHFLSEWPDDIVTYANRKNKLIVTRNKTLICHFASDSQNYRRFPKVMGDIAEYQKYLGAVFPDITVTKDMDVEFQKLALLANQLYAAVLAVNNIKLVANTRCGSNMTQRYLRQIPRNVIWASSFLGCDKTSDFSETAEYINKILSLMPSRLIIYGKQDPEVNCQLDIMGINYRYYEDFHRRCKKEAV